MPDVDLETLWNEMHSRLCRFVCSRFADEADAEDILQDVYLRIHANLEARWRRCRDRPIRRCGRARSRMSLVRAAIRPRAA